MQPHQLLDEYIEQIQLGNKMYDRAKAERVYAKLTAPKTIGTFYDANRVRGTIDPDGQVSFQAQYPELRDDLFGDDGGWSHRSPEELGVTRISPRPVRGLSGMQKAFNAHLKNPDGSIRSAGSGLYYNQPISDHRAKAYTALGFKQDTWDGLQYLDNRRFKGNPTIAELLALMDAEQMGYVSSTPIRDDLIARHPEIAQRVITRTNSIGSPATRAGLSGISTNTDEETAAFLGMTLAEYRAGNNSYYDDAPF